MPVDNKPQHGDMIVGNQLTGEGWPAKAPFQEFLDKVAELVNDNESGIAELGKILQDFIALADTLYVVAAYGSIQLGGSTALPNITTDFQTLPFEAATLATPRLVIQDFANDALILQRTGVWELSISFSLGFIDTNAGRTFDVRLYNTTIELELVRTVVFVGRNQEGTNYSISLLFELPEALVGHMLTVQVGNASADFTSVVLDANLFNAVHVAERNVGG